MASVFDGVPALQNFDITPALSAYRTGTADKAVNDKRLSDIAVGQQAATGDLSGAASTAFRGGDLSTGVSLSNVDQAQSGRVADIISKAAVAADTPQKWSNFLGVLKQRFPHADLTPFADFGQRQNLLAEGGNLPKPGGAPSDFILNADGSETPRPGGPADPDYLKSVADAKGGSSAGAGLFGMGGMTGPDGQPVNTTDVSMVSDAAFTGGRNEEFIQALPQAARGVVSGLIDYTIDPKSLSTRKSPKDQLSERLAFIAAAKQADPTFSMAEYPARSAFVRNLASGPLGAGITSMNKVIGHLDELVKASKELDNFNIPILNGPYNLGRRYAQGNTAVTNYETTASAVSTEMDKAMKGTGAADVAGIADWRKNVDVNGNPAQQQESAAKMVDLLSSQIAAVREQYIRTMGKPPPHSFLSQKSKDILTKLGFDPVAVEGGDEPVDTGTSGGSAQPAEAPSEEDIQHTMQLHGMTREQVLQAIGQ